jgi:DNA ligase D-like protein (predicted ligase)
MNHASQIVPNGTGGRVPATHNRRACRSYQAAEVGMIERLLPMLAVSSPPFDSPEHVFEVKWDGVRALAAVEASGWRIWGRERSDYTQRYPELESLRSLPAGTVLDGELIVLESGRAAFATLMRRHQLVNGRKIQEASRFCPVTYVVFDLLYAGGQSLLGRPLCERRQRLQELVGQQPHCRLAFSDGLVGAGRDFFQKVVEQGHEGVLAKHLGSRYRPGKRNQAWRKIKPFRTLPCVVIGYTVSRDGIRSLLVAADRQGKLQYVAELTGLSDAAQGQLAPGLFRRPRRKPLVPCPKRGQWVEPELYCQVRYLAWTHQGRLRGAHYRGLIQA